MIPKSSGSLEKLTASPTGWRSASAISYRALQYGPASISTTVKASR